MFCGPTQIDDTFAEAFRMRYARLIVTAEDDFWLDAACRAATGYASSIIGCDCEAGVELSLSPAETPDGRAGKALLFFGFSAEQVAAAVLNRTGQCLLTCPTTAVFDGLPAAAERFPVGSKLRFFGDGFQKSKQLAGRRYWRIPVMDGEFVVEESAGVEKGIGGGNLILQGESLAETLAAVRRGLTAMTELPGVIAPFPGGAVRSGSKVGSRYKALRASTADAFCPTLRGRTDSRLHPRARHACEIVIDGVDEDAIRQAMRAVATAAAGPDLVAISAGNYGGKLGKFHFRLRDMGIGDLHKNHLG